VTIRSPARRVRRSQVVALAGAIVSLTITTGSTAATKRPYRPTCRSGSTLFHHGQVRAFRVSFYDAADRGQHQEALVCLHRSGKPVVIFDPGPFNSVQAGRFHVVGSRLGFVIHDQGFANGSETDVGWVDLRSGAVAIGLLNAGENPEATDPLLPEDAIGYAFAANGTSPAVRRPDRTDVPDRGLLIRGPGRRPTRRLVRAPGPAVRLDTIAALQGDDEERA
jgi:hypothetical protein